jgi:hypothetical protein
VSKTWYTTPDGLRVGASSTGCIATAQGAVYGSVHNWLVIFYLPQDLNDEAADTYRDRPVQQASEAYRSCMAAGGHPAHYPQDAQRMARQWGATAADADHISDQEIQLATADARCRTSSHLDETIDTAFEARSADWLTRHENATLRAADILRAAQRTARAAR